MLNNYGIEIECSNEKGTILIEGSTLKITTPSFTKHIIINDVSKIQTKDSPNGQFYLRIVSQEDMILIFRTSQTRDFFKSFLFFKQQKLKENIIEPKIHEDTNCQKALIEEIRLPSFKQVVVLNPHIEMDGLENTKSSLIDFLSYNPVLLSIFDEMNCSLHQFYNYLKSSFFYNITNEKNVIDRLLNEKLRNYKVSENSFATRINNFSFMNVKSESLVIEEEKKIPQNYTDFHPLYISKKVSNREKVNDFEFPVCLNLVCEAPLKLESPISYKDYDKILLKTLLESCKKVYHAKKEGREYKEYALRIEETYKELFKDKNLESFRPGRFL